MLFWRELSIKRFGDFACSDIGLALREVGRHDDREIAVHIDYCFGEVHGIRAIVGEHGVRRPVEFTMPQPKAYSPVSGVPGRGFSISGVLTFGAWMKRKVSGLTIAGPRVPSASSGS